MTRPRARVERLVVREIAGETLVYDLERHKAHHLNATASRVWRLCDGEHDAVGMTAELAQVLGIPADEAVAGLALRQLEKAHLLQRGLEPLPPSPSRRAIMRTLGIGVALLPAIVSLVAPTPAEAAACSAATNRDCGCPCTPGSGGAQCSGWCCGSICCKNFGCTHCTAGC